MIDRTRIFAAAIAPLLFAPALLAQQPKAPPAYPERDILTPFRTCDEIVAPPDKAMVVLRRMRALAEDPSAHRDFDKDGREVVDDDGWRAARAELAGIQLDAGHLAQVIRGSRNVDDRDVAFYGAFYCTNVDHVLNLIGHIPGEPEPRTRQKSYPRAVAFLRAHVGKRWGDLTEEDRAIVLRNMPKPGSPEALSMGIQRAPQDGDMLHDVNLRPYFQLLDRDIAIDQAQALWFLKECFIARRDLAARWVEPALPRIDQLLLGEDAAVSREAAGLLLAIGPPELKPLPADADKDARRAFADQAGRAMFPPLRPVSPGLVLLLPGADRDELVRAGIAALADSATGESVSGTTKDGLPFRGYRIAAVPKSLEVLQLPVGAVVTAINGRPVADGAQIRAAIAAQFTVIEGTGRIRPVSTGKLVVDYLRDGASYAMEYRVE